MGSRKALSELRLVICMSLSSSSSDMHDLTLWSKVWGCRGGDPHTVGNILLQYTGQKCSEARVFTKVVFEIIVPLFLSSKRVSRFQVSSVKCFY